MLLRRNRDFGIEVMTFVKICGITNLEDALACVDAGADALGFNFYTRSPRFVRPHEARTIISSLPREILTVGIFVNESSPTAVEELACEAGVTALQLHGDESPDFCAALSSRYVIKALTIGPEFQPSTALKYSTQALMVDAFDRKARGGTGHVANWTVAREIRELVPKLFLAGGLSAANVGDAISTVAPYAVDACSALEAYPGKKDQQKVRAFVRAVHAVDES